MHGSVGYFYVSDLVSQRRRINVRLQWFPKDYIAMCVT